MTTTTTRSRPPRSRPPVDPRMRARRIEVKRGEGRQRLRRMMWLAVVLAVVAAGFGVTRSPLLAVHSVQVTGAHHSTAAAIRSASGVQRGQPMVDLSTSGAAERVESLPWVADAKVQRKWPRTVTIAVTERTPAARVKAGGTWLVIDRSGRVLERVATVSRALVQVVWSGPAAAPGATLAVPRSLVRLAAAVPAELRASVTAAASERGVLELRLEHDAVVRIGDASALRDKLVAAVTLLETPAASCAALIDVTVPAAPTLTTRPGCA